jgi:hypothetical protein
MPEPAVKAGFDIDTWPAKAAFPVDLVGTAHIDGAENHRNRVLLMKAGQE